MSKKPDAASALAGIIKARRGDDAAAAEPVPEVRPMAPVEELPPSPALPPTPSAADESPRSPAKKELTGKSSDKANYNQFSVYLRKDTRKKVGRTLEDLETGQDFSDLVQELLEQWLKAKLPNT